MKREKDNLIQVHEIYIRKIRSKVRQSGNDLDQNSKRVLMESLMASHSKSFIKRDFQKKTNGVNVQAVNRRRTEDREFKDSETVDEREVSLAMVSEKTEELKSKLNKFSPKKRENIIKALEVRKRLVNQL